MRLSKMQINLPEFTWDQFSTPDCMKEFALQFHTHLCITLKLDINKSKKLVSLIDNYILQSRMQVK